VVLALAISLPSVVLGADSKFVFGEADIPYSGSACGSAVAIAFEKGFFAEEGVKVNIVSGVTFEIQRTGLGTGKIAVSNGDFQFFPAVNNGIDVKIISGIHEGCIKVLVAKDSPIKSVAELKGKTIGVDEIGGTPMSVASVILGHLGYNPTTDVTWKPFPNDQLWTAIDKGEVDVIVAWDPFATILEQKGYRVLSDISTDPLFAGKYCCFLFASGKLVKQDPAKIAAILRGYNKGVEWIGKNPAAAAKILVEKKYVATDDVKLLAKLLASYKYATTHTETGVNSVGNKAKADALYFAKELVKAGYLPKNLNADKFIDGIYVDIFALEKEAAAKKKK
jgi:NitT/TauT family transport system substrate-binding protein